MSDKILTAAMRLFRADLRDQTPPIKFIGGDGCAELTSRWQALGGPGRSRYMAAARAALPATQALSTWFRPGANMETQSGLEDQKHAGEGVLEESWSDAKPCDVSMQRSSAAPG